MLNYLYGVRSRMASPLRIRVGGNSMDGAGYSRDQGNMIQLIGTPTNVNDIPVSYSPGLFDVLESVGGSVKGATYMLGLSLRTPANDSHVIDSASDALTRLGGSLDAFLLGNVREWRHVISNSLTESSCLLLQEPDLYLKHGNRPGYANYTYYDYVSLCSLNA